MGTVNDLASNVSNSGRVTMMDVTQMGIALGFSGAAIYLTVKGLPVPGDLWTLTVGIVSFYMGKRVYAPTPNA